MSDQTNKQLMELLGCMKQQTKELSLLRAELEAVKEAKSIATPWSGNSKSSAAIIVSQKENILGSKSFQLLDTNTKLLQKGITNVLHTLAKEHHNKDILALNYEKLLAQKSRLLKAHNFVGQVLKDQCPFLDGVNFGPAVGCIETLEKAKNDQLFCVVWKRVLSNFSSWARYQKMYFGTSMPRKATKAEHVASQGQPLTTEQLDENRRVGTSIIVSLSVSLFLTDF